MPLVQRTRPQIGDVVEIPTPVGLAYAQYTHKHEAPPKYGALIRVLPGFHRSRPTEFSSLVHQEPQFVTFFPLGAAWPVSTSTPAPPQTLDLMNAAQFYEAFLDGWTHAQARAPLKRLAGKTLKWKSTTPAGAITFAFATNSKAAGLLPHLPGEFRLRIRWNRKNDDVTKTDDVSWFQYTTEEEARKFGALQRTVLEKFLAQPGKQELRGIYNYSADPAWLPRPNFDEEIYYFDAADARAWGHWYAVSMAPWLERFTAAPETFNAWCWRVLWAGTERPVQDEA